MFGSGKGLAIFFVFVVVTVSVQAASIPDRSETSIPEEVKVKEGAPTEGAKAPVVVDNGNSTVDTAAINEDDVIGRVKREDEFSDEVLDLNILAANETGSDSPRSSTKAGAPISFDRKFATAFTFIYALVFLGKQLC